MSIVAVEWRSVVGQEGIFEVSVDGEVRSLDRQIHCMGAWGEPVVKNLKGRMRKLSPDKDGYLMLVTATGNFKVHHLVLQSFVSVRPPGYEANHKNGIKHDNRVVNLEWVTPKQNIRHAMNLGLIVPERHAKHTQEQIEHAYRLVESGLTHKDAASKAGVTISAIANLVAGQTWQHLGLPRIRRNRSKNWCKS